MAGEQQQGGGDGQGAGAGASGAQGSEEKTSGLFDGAAIEDPGASSAQDAPIDPDPVTALEAKADGEGEGDGSQGGEAEGEGEAGQEKTGEVESTKKLLAGRYEKVEDLEKAYGESSAEGMRLYKELRSTREELSKRDQAIEDLKAEVEAARKAPAFKELTAEELADLKQRDPAAAADYIVERKFRERDEAARKEAEKAKKEAAQAERQRTAKAIEADLRKMESDPKSFPDFTALKPLMEEIDDATGGELTGRTWTPRLMYYAALGVKHLQALKKGKAAGDDARDKAKATAQAQARSSGAAGKAQAGAPRETPGELSDEEFNKRLLAAAPKSVFSKF